MDEVTSNSTPVTNVDPTPVPHYIISIDLALDDCHFKGYATATDAAAVILGDGAPNNGKYSTVAGATTPGVATDNAVSDLCCSIVADSASDIPCHCASSDG